MPESSWAGSVAGRFRNASVTSGSTAFRTKLSISAILMRYPVITSGVPRQQISNSLHAKRPETVGQPANVLKPTGCAVDNLLERPIAIRTHLESSIMNRSPSSPYYGGTYVLKFFSLFWTKALALTPIHRLGYTCRETSNFAPGRARHEIHFSAGPIFS